MLNKKDKIKIEQFFDKCKTVVDDRNIATGLLHGSAVRKYEKHNDLDLFVLCSNDESKKRLQKTFDERNYIDPIFALYDNFVNNCRKPFSDGYASNMASTDEYFRFQIILSVIHGTPIYKIEKGTEVLRRAENDLRNYFGERFDGIMKSWEIKYK